MLACTATRTTSAERQRRGDWRSCRPRRRARLELARIARCRAGSRTRSIPVLTGYRASTRAAADARIRRAIDPSTSRRSLDDSADRPFLRRRGHEAHAVVRRRPPLPASASMSEATTRAPIAANASTVARPIPDAAPVTTARALGPYPPAYRSPSSAMRGMRSAQDRRDLAIPMTIGITSPMLTSGARRRLLRTVSSGSPPPIAKSGTPEQLVVASR